ncbi:LacI family DNA-binding transcriptional regulator [Caulobacter sp. SSI4214]|uniref:LacI family DNA-binding transcriptional regulator n=1 Tax=Caulobacter sp. SSI4214 TaxID=2575739 RepID=UPI00143984EB|nr:LacI family DNA-binding transcriptional regulator [Caulobacter sp. SSI4214]
MIGKHPAASLSVTIDDVARAAGVSIRTVSRVLNDSPKVGGATREAVQAIIRELGYSPSARARALATGRSNLIAVVQDDPNAHVIGVMQRGIANVCARHGFELVVHPVRFSDPDVAQNVERFAQRSRVDGLIVLPPASEIDAIPQRLTAMGVPSIGIASIDVTAYPCMLISDERSAAAELGRHLLQLGHRRIAIIEGPPRFQSAQQRKAGFLEALAASGAPVELERREGDYGFESGMTAAASLLGMKARPTAIFACNDIMAAAVVKAAREAGLDMPSQLSVAGFDDSDLASMISPALTTIRRPLSEMAETATERLLAMINDRPPELRRQAVPLSVVRRQSTAAIGVGDART